VGILPAMPCGGGHPARLALPARLGHPACPGHPAGLASLPLLRWAAGI